MRWIALLLAILIAYPPSVSAAGDKPRGNKAVISHDGKKYQGTLLSVSNDNLVLKEKNSGEILGFAAAEVDKVTIRRSKAGAGILAGLAIGAGLTGIILISIPKKADSLSGALAIVLLTSAAIVAGIVITALSVASGGILGSVFGWKKFKLDKMNPAQREAAWEKLKKYALFADQLPDELHGRLIMVAKRSAAH